jgi:hypothetical protein
MSLLNFDSSGHTPKGEKKTLKLLFGIGALVGVVALGSTLAASINLNSGGPVEFGQGVVQTTACDDEITVTPISTFVNAVGYGSHMFTSLRISGIDSSEGKCSGKRFLIKAYGDNGILDIFNYYEEIENPDSDPTVIQEDYDTIEIANNGGEFTWVSGGTDNDDVIPGPEGYITETSFTLIFSSGSISPNTITRTPLASAEDVKRITVETYDSNLLADRILTTSQLSLFSYGDFEQLDIGFDGTDDPLPGGNFDGTCETSCTGYFTVHDWIMNATADDLDTYNNALGTENLTRSQISAGITTKFTYDPDAVFEERWRVEFRYSEVNIYGLLGAPIESIPGIVFGFDGNTGVFVPTVNGPGEPEIFIFFSLNGALQNNPSIGNFIPYGDQPTRSVPIRNFIEIWNGSEVPYIE